MKFLFACLCCLCLCLSYAQSTEDVIGPFRNPSFEGTPIPNQSTPAPYWYNCPDAKTTSDLQPNHSDVTLPPQDGNNYLGMVVRSGTCVECQEKINQSLVYPLSKDSCYFFQIALAHENIKGYSGYSGFALIEIWGGTESCVKKELLWTSPRPPNNYWISHDVFLAPSEDYNHLMIQAIYDPAENNTNYRGHILMDNIHNFRAFPRNYQLDLGADLELCRKENVLLDIHPPETYSLSSIEWSDGSHETSLLVKETGTYWVEVSTGCAVYRDTIIIRHDPCMQIPNVITPNGDAYNQFFDIDGIQKGTWYLNIYDRLGKLVYESRDYHNDWEGEGLPTAVYYYHLYSPTYTENYKGWVEIKR